MRTKEQVLERFAEFLYVFVQGGTTYYPMDAYFLEDENVMSAEEFNVYESDLCTYFDDGYFQCVQCGWTLPIDILGSDEHLGELMCMDCEES